MYRHKTTGINVEFMQHQLYYHRDGLIRFIRYVEFLNAQLVGGCTHCTSLVLTIVQRCRLQNPTNERTNVSFWVIGTIRLPFNLKKFAFNIKNVGQE